MKALITLFLFLCAFTPCFSQPTPAQIERSQELLDKEKALREELERGEKVFVKKVIVKGATLLKPEKIEAIILPLEGHWLTKEDIRQVRALIEQAYLENGYLNEIKGVSSLVKKQILEIQIEEVGH